MSKAPKKAYWELLRDPRWQKKRLEIMQRDGFKCVRCRCETETLNVHHGWYGKGKAPWDYSSHTLWTLCEACHETVQDSMAEIHESIGCIHPRDLEYAEGELSKINHQVFVNPTTTEGLGWGDTIYNLDSHGWGCLCHKARLSLSLRMVQEEWGISIYCEECVRPRAKVVAVAAKTIAAMRAEAATILDAANRLERGGDDV